MKRHTKAGAELGAEIAQMGNGRAMVLHPDIDTRETRGASGQGQRRSPEGRLDEALGLAEAIDLEMKPQSYFRKGSGGVYFGIRAHHGALAILGQVFMENFDVVFDRANKRIGFAPIQGCGN